MRICDNCGAEFDSREQYCPNCGAPVDEEPAEYFDEQPDDRMKTCPQCGDYVPLDADKCPSCGYVFYKKRNTKLYAMIGGGILVVALIVVVIILLTNRKTDVTVTPEETAEPIAITTQAPAEDVTVEPTAEPAAAATEAPAAAENDVLSAHRDEALTVFELLEPATDGNDVVTVNSLEGKMKSVSVSTAETYVTKLLSLAFGDSAGFEYSFYRGDDSTWRLVMSGTLKDDQMTKMLALDDENIYATFRSMYLNTARSVIVTATSSQPIITLSVYASGKSGDDYTLRIVEPSDGNGTVSRAETTA